ncbi:DUF6777 domain-containing protein [Gordonia sp. ABSL49_1]|uniref:DUF6777 domain-containing protein n=1 Tax=Gordonia sp. ABSL49_1 TaxID=2920941 RepID=UPI001F0D242D|nr:DUF6777 domain-containing protein [Gordonia sp. ABSL49_1]MCH5642972.1 hypothetical protein [Gordonia sp. ABSL49_1]
MSYYSPPGPPTYPPGPYSGAQPAAPRPRRGLTYALAAIVVVLALVLVAGFIFVTKSKDDNFTIPGLTLTSANEPGIDPFTTPANVAQRTSLDKVHLSAQVGAPKDGTRQVNGTQPGLYARGGPTCDTNALARNLTADQRAATAWAGVFGIRTSSIPHYLNTLSSVSLTADTWVTDHAYKDGSARPYQAVLQNGTSVLIDSAGVPRVRCAGGNPLTPPAETPVGGYRLEGRQWEEYQTKLVTRVCPNDRRVDTVDNKPMIVPVPPPPPPGPDGNQLPGQGFLTLVDPLTGNTYGLYLRPEINDISLYPPLEETLPDPIRINVPFVPADEEQARDNGLARAGSPLPADHLLRVASEQQNVPQGAPDSESSEPNQSSSESTEPNPSDISTEPSPSEVSTEPSTEPTTTTEATTTTTTTEPTVEQTTEQTTVETTQPTTEPTVEQTTQPEAVPEDTGAVTTTAPAS